MGSKPSARRELERVEGKMDNLDSLSRDLRTEIERLDELFWVSGETLKAISKRFQEELDEGLQENGRNIAMYLTWVLGFPTGHERGAFLALDLGGTNIRVCWIELAERKGETKVMQSQYKIPDDLKTGSADQLWNFVAESLEKFTKEQGLNGSENEPLPLGFTFSYPAIQDYIDHGVLQTWTKGFDIDGVEGQDVAEQVQEAIAKRKLPIRLIALINDTTGALIASAYNDPDTIVGAIFGTGCNAAYMEQCSSIPKLKSHDQAKDLPSDTRMAINCEYGAFDNSHSILPRTPYDETVDEQSPRPGEQTFEKMSAGLYLGEIFRLILLELHSKGLIFPDQTNLSYLQSSYSIDTGVLSFVENDDSADMGDTKNRFRREFNITPSHSDLRAMKHIAITVAVRGARLCACGVAAICRKSGIQKGHVAADGSVANKHPKFRRRWGQALGEILDWKEDREDDPIVLTSAEDGSGIGAAVITAMTLERAEKGQMVGIRAGAQQKKVST
ncbi:putative hexokinase HXK1 [Rhizodiscina lignyota]|uniref:Phosphotransferase n=1 Tax=Rhizodiscina lignyota TaxID=1504668 RepID=A0A9P4IBA7_9PEZI|nr:putative hexokinase HXK1 [Rhizodiscina lignyota]